MKKKDVVVGKTYLVKVSGTVVPVRLRNESLYGGWDGVNTVTGRAVRVKTAGRLRGEYRPVVAKTHDPACARNFYLGASSPCTCEVEVARASSPTVAEQVREETAKLFA